MKKKYQMLISKITSLILAMLTIFGIYLFMRGTLGLYTGCSYTSYTEVLFGSDIPKKLKIDDFNNPVKFPYVYWIDDIDQGSCDKIVLFIYEIIEGFMYGKEIENYSLEVNTDYNINDYFEWDGYFDTPERRFIERGTISLKIGFKNSFGDWRRLGGDKRKIRIWGDDDTPPLDDQPQIAITSIDNSGVFNDIPILKTEVWVRFPDYPLGQRPHFQVYLGVDGDESNPLDLDHYYGEDIWIPHLEWGGSKGGEISVVANLMAEVKDPYGNYIPIIYQSEEKSVSCTAVPDPREIEVEYDYQEGYEITKLGGDAQDNAFAAAGIKLNFLDPDTVLEKHMFSYEDRNEETSEFISLHKNKGKNAYICGIYGFGYDTDFDGKADLLKNELKGISIPGPYDQSGVLICLGVENYIDFAVIHEMGHHIGFLDHCLNQCVLYNYNTFKKGLEYNVSNYNFYGKIYLNWNIHFCPYCVSWLKSEKINF